jgi:hypothetical protein
MIRRLLALALLAWSALAAGHPMPESRVLVDTRPDGAVLTLQLPLNRLEFAYGQPLADTPSDVLARHGEGLARYLLQHVGARSGNMGWQALKPQLTVVGQDSSAELQAVVVLRAPPGADPRRFTLLYDTITHEVRTHRGLVYLRKDWEAGHVAEPMQLLGTVDAQHNTLGVELGDARPGSGFRSLLAHGMQHIAEGTDHVLFLLTLLLVAPLTRSGRRWAAARSAGDALRRLLAVVTAFTAGHSVTLSLGSLGLITLPSVVVETAVAVSIAVAAVHALRPLLPEGEIWMAGGFGLLHGLAFSASLSGAGLTPGQHALALLGFNLGIEAMQLMIVLAVAPPIVMLARAAPRAFGRLKALIAGTAALAALALIVERLGLGPAGVSDGLAATSTAGPVLVGLLWGGALLATHRSRTQGAAAA